MNSDPGAAYYSTPGLKIRLLKRVPNARAITLPHPSSKPANCVPFHPGFHRIF
jgi:hypothetical protein